METSTLTYLITTRPPFSDTPRQPCSRPYARASTTASVLATQRAWRRKSPQSSSAACRPSTRFATPTPARSPRCTSAAWSARSPDAARSPSLKGSKSALLQTGMKRHTPCCYSGANADGGAWSAAAVAWLQVPRLARFGRVERRSQNRRPSHRTHAEPSRRRHAGCHGGGERKQLFSPLLMIILPRQARDKRRENSQKRPFSRKQLVVILPWDLDEAEAVLAAHDGEIETPSSPFSSPRPLPR
jgi:hypothetical protein